MSRTVTNANARGRTGISRNPDGLPKPGTRLRALYEVYLAHAGHKPPPEEIKALLVGTRTGTLGDCNTALKDFYGCDIRDGALMGETRGRDYVDYTKKEN